MRKLSFILAAIFLSSLTSTSSAYEAANRNSKSTLMNATNGKKKKVAETKADKTNLERKQVVAKKPKAKKIPKDG